MVIFRSAPFSTRQVVGTPISRTTCVPNGTSLLVKSPASALTVPLIPVASTTIVTIRVDADVPVAVTPTVNLPGRGRC